MQLFYLRSGIWRDLNVRRKLLAVGQKEKFYFSVTVIKIHAVMAAKIRPIVFEDINYVKKYNSLLDLKKRFQSTI